MTQKQNSNVPAIIVCILLFGMISFVTNLASPMGDVLKFYLAGQEITIPNWMATLGVFCNFIAYAVMGIPGLRTGIPWLVVTCFDRRFFSHGLQYLCHHGRQFLLIQIPTPSHFKTAGWSRRRPWVSACRFPPASVAHLPAPRRHP